MIRPVDVATWALTGVCVLALLVILLMALVDLDHQVDGPVEVSEIPDVSVGEADLALPEPEYYALINERPLFNEDRRPAPEEPDAPIELETDPDAVAQATELNAAVLGTMVTPEGNLAIVQDNAAGETVILREGASLEGDQSAWTLAAVSARKVRFTDGQGREAELELPTFDKPLAAGAAASGPGNAQDQRRQRIEERRAQREEELAQAVALEEAAEGDGQAQDADELRRKIAARRAKLRAEAARRRAQELQEQQEN